MGQKINPNTIRLGRAGNLPNSIWIYDKKKYSNTVILDMKIRSYITTILQNFNLLGTISISNRRSEILHKDVRRITINLLYPRDTFIKQRLKTFVTAGYKESLKTKYKTILLKKLLQLLKIQRLDSNIFNEVKIVFYKSIYEEPNLTCTYIATLLNKRIPYKRIIKEIYLNVPKNKLTGLKIRLSGRLNGAEIARSEYKVFGRLPLQTIDANISFAQYSCNTVHGVMGISVWIYKK